MTHTMDLANIKLINDAAISHFQRGNYLEAQRLTCTALRKVRELAVEDQDEDNCPLFGSMENNGTETHSIRLKATEDCFEGIYSAAFRLTGDIPMCVPETAAVLLFNLALFQHQKAMKSNQSQDVAKAVGLYQQAHEILTMDGEPQSVLLTVLIAAIYNNLAHLFQTSCDFENCSSMLGCLEETLSWLHQLGFSSFIEEDLGFFCSNLYFANLNNCKFAPAA